MRTITWTTLALLAFAANSILCRIALHEAAIDPATFSTIRVASGAATLLLVTALSKPPGRKMPASLASAGLLALYAIPFAFAYTQLSAGTGALIMFACVQATMLIAAVHGGERPRAAQWLGLGLALAGLVYLVLPGLSAPPRAAAALMGLAGVAWGLYSVRGRSARSPLAQTAGNFALAVPIVIVVSVMAKSQYHLESRGLWLAVASGALASGLGYVLWYAALGGLTATHAAIVQLAVPVLASSGGVVFLQEHISMRLIVSTIVILGGIALAILGGGGTSVAGAHHPE